MNKLNAFLDSCYSTFLDIKDIISDVLHFYVSVLLTVFIYIMPVGIVLLVRKLIYVLDELGSNPNYINHK